MKARVEFKPRNFWVGVYLKIAELQLSDTKLNVILSRYPYVSYPRQLHVYICPIPMLTIHIQSEPFRYVPFNFRKYVVEVENLEQATANDRD